MASRNAGFFNLIYKKMKNTIFTILLCLILTSCGVGKRNFEQRLDETRGYTEAKLIRDRGMPNNIYTAEDGTKYMTYSINRGYAGYGTSGAAGNYYTSGSLYCNITYILDAKKKVVINTTYDGTDCYRLISNVLG